MTLFVLVNTFLLGNNRRRLFKDDTRLFSRDHDTAEECQRPSAGKASNVSVYQLALASEGSLTPALQLCCPLRGPPAAVALGVGLVGRRVLCERERRPFTDVVTKARQELPENVCVLTAR